MLLIGDLMTARLFRLTSAVAVALMAIAMFALPAQAGGRTLGPEQWKPYTAQDFTSLAGVYCAFDLRVASVKDDEEVRVDARYPDGSVRVYEFRGTLVSRFTNLATGKSVVRDLSGDGVETLRADGKLESFGGIGPFSIGFHASDPYPQGYYRLDGVHLVTFDADGTRHMTVAFGPEENLCKTLG